MYLYCRRNPEDSDQSQLIRIRTTYNHCQIAQRCPDEDLCRLKSFKNRYRFLHVLNPLPTSLYETSRYTYLDCSLTKEFGILALGDLFKVGAVFQHHITHFSNCSLEGIIQHLPLTVFQNDYYPKA